MQIATNTQHHINGDGRLYRWQALRLTKDPALFNGIYGHPMPMNTHDLLFEVDREAAQEEIEMSVMLFYFNKKLNAS